MRFPLALFALLALLSPAFAQTARYELGQRLRQFEAAWETADDAGKKRALKIVPKVTNQFFSFQLGEAGRTLDDARHALTSDKPRTAEQQWADSLYAEPETRVIDSGAKELTVKVQAFYPVKADKPKGLAVRLTLGQTKPVEVAVGKLPLSVVIPLPPVPDILLRTDVELRIESMIAARVAGNKRVAVSHITGSAEGFPAAAKLLDAGKETLAKDSLELATLKDRVELLKDLAGGTVFETDYPAAKLFTEAQEMAKLGAAKKPYFTPDRTGQFWLSVPTAKSRTACRLLVPKGLDAKKPVPLVVALHGAGGSENLFFEGYGNGHIVKLCEKRGWLLVAPRLGLGFVGSPVPVGEIVNKLAERYPIDPKAVFVVGHSMGASATIEAAQKYPGQFAAVAALGGGGRVKADTAKSFAELPTFVGVGTADFARAGAKSLSKALTDSGAKRVTFTEYDGIEHLVIVREALADVFALFDKIATK
jgi:predicted esterase